jgi:choline kinase
MPSCEQVTNILSSLRLNRTTAGEFIVALLQNDTLYPEAIESICVHARWILDTFVDVPGARAAVTEHAMLMTQDMCTHEVAQLTERETGFQFGAHNIQESQLAEADINEMATKMEGVAPTTWNILDSLLSADLYNNRRREARRLGTRKQCSKVSAGHRDIEMDTPSDEENDERDAATQHANGLIKIVCFPVTMS